MEKNKPKEIIELERELGIELTEAKDSDDLNFGVRNYLLDEKKKVIGLNLYRSQVSDASFLGNLTSLTTLYLRANQLIDISFLKKLTNLKNLSLRENQIKDIGALEYLKNLTILSLNYNQISDIGVLKKLTNLRELYLGYNQITNFTLDFINNFPILEYLSLYNNPIPIPPEFLGKNELDNCLLTLRDYFKSIENEEDRQELNEAKLIFVGRGHVGKSELAEALSEPDYVFEEGRKSTEGIRIKKWEMENCQKKDKNINFSVNIWDFAGQEINYGTHQFFLTKNSLYILVWENRLEDPTHKISLEYWLNIIALLSSHSPVLVVQNKIDEKETDVQEEQLLAQFPNIKGFYKTSCKKGLGITELSQKIRELIVELPHTNEIWNKHRVAIREAIEENSENYFTYSEYLKLCKLHEVDEKSAAFLAQQLHNIGLLLHYADFPRLKDTVVLKPEWATQAAYKLIDAKLNPHKGYFKEADLERIWADEQFDGKRLFLLDLMKRFDLVFNLLGTDEYIVPDLLSIYSPKNLPELPQNNKLVFEYHYDFMPQGIMSRFICRNAGYLGDDFYIRENFFWRYGVYLQQNGAKAKVVMNDFGNAYIRMEVSGEHSEQFLYTLRSFMQDIHKKLSEPDFKEVIPCPCAECSKQIEHKKRHFFEYKRLIKLKEKGKKWDTCDISIDDISIEKLLTGIEPIETDEERRHRELKEKLDGIKVDTTEIKADTKQILQVFTQEFSELKAKQNLQEEDRFRLLGELIDKQKPQNLAFYAQKAQIEFPKFNALQSESKNFVAMGFYFLEILPDSGDFSPAALQFCRALELEMKAIFKNFKTSSFKTLPNYPTQNNETYKHFQNFVDIDENKITLGQMLNVVDKAISTTPLNYQLFIDFGNFLIHWKNLSILSQFLAETNIFTQGQNSPRNKSAHTHAIPKSEAEDCKVLVLKGLDLWL